MQILCKNSISMPEERIFFHHAACNYQTCLAWESTFPKGYTHTSLSYLVNCKGFYEAKHGDFDAAKNIVRKCVKSDIVMEMRKCFPDAVLLPVYSSNKLPLALATEIGLPVQSALSVQSKSGRKRMTPIERLLHHVILSGNTEKGRNYILVDDVIKHGGVLSEMRKHIVSSGGRVAAVTALANAKGGNNLAITSEIKSALERKFGQKLTTFLRKYSISREIGELTLPQAKYILRFSAMKTLEQAAENCLKTSKSGDVQKLIIEPLLPKENDLLPVPRDVIPINIF